MFQKTGFLCLTWGFSRRVLFFAWFAESGYYGVRMGKTESPRAPLFALALLSIGDCLANAGLGSACG
jgi:hypothetical protein